MPLLCSTGEVFLKKILQVCRTFIKIKSLQVGTINPSYSFCNMFSNLQNAPNIVRVFLRAFDD